MNNKKKITVCIIGCGRIFKRHFSAINDNFNKFDLVAICDKNLDKTKNLQLDKNIKKFQNYVEMVASVNPDMVSVLVDSGSHYQIVKELIGKVKVVVVEKPFTLKLSHTDELVEMAKKTKTSLFVVKQNRYNLPVLAAENALALGRLGKLLLGTIRVRLSRHQPYYDQAKWRGTWWGDGGVITNQASHHLDLLLKFMGPAKRVSAIAKTHLADIETEDTLVALIEFENGAVGTIEATTATRPSDLEGSISILGSKGSVEIGGFAVNRLQTWKFDEEIEEDKYTIKNASENPPDVYGFGHQRYYETLYDVIEGDLVSSFPSAEESRKSLELIHAIYKSVEISGFVDLPLKEEFDRLG